MLCCKEMAKMIIVVYFILPYFQITKICDFSLTLKLGLHFL